MTDDELFTAAIEAAERSVEVADRVLVSTREDLLRLGLNADQAATRLHISVDDARQLLSGEVSSVQGAIERRYRHLANLACEIQAEPDAYRNGLLRCAVTGSSELEVHCHRPSAEFVERWELRARELGVSLSWATPLMGMTAVLEVIAQIEKSDQLRAAVRGVELAGAELVVIFEEAGPAMDELPRWVIVRVAVDGD